jgi:hypothetical protein
MLFLFWAVSSLCRVFPESRLLIIPFLLPFCDLRFQPIFTTLNVVDKSSLLNPYWSMLSSSVSTGENWGYDMCVHDRLRPADRRIGSIPRQGHIADIKFFRLIGRLDSDTVSVFEFLGQLAELDSHDTLIGAWTWTATVKRLIGCICRDTLDIAAEMNTDAGNPSLTFADERLQDFSSGVRLWGRFLNCITIECTSCENILPREPTSRGIQLCAQTSLHRN